MNFYEKIELKIPNLTNNEKYLVRSILEINDKEDLRGDLFLWRTLQPIKVAHQLNKKIIIFGQSVGGFATIKSEKIAAKYLKLCDKILVREKLSYDLLAKYNVKNLELIPDTSDASDEEGSIHLIETKL